MFTFAFIKWFNDYVLVTGKSFFLISWHQILCYKLKFYLMKNIKLNQILAYIPFNVKVIYKDDVDCIEVSTVNHINSILDGTYKMVLNPLSELSKNIVCEITEKCLLDETEIVLLDNQTRPVAYKNGVNSRLSYQVVNELLQRKFDIFGLIYHNLAFDCNCL